MATGPSPRSGTVGGPDDPAAAPSALPTNRWPVVAVGLGLVLAVWLVFGQTRRHEFINYDDQIYVTENAHVSAGLTWTGLGWAFANVKAGFWHPLTWLSHMLDCQWFGTWAGGHHLVSLGWHAANTLLLLALLRQLTGALWRSALVAALFAVHPLHVQSVAWAAERKDVLSTFFGLLALLFYARYAQSKIADRRSPIASYALALLFFALGLMSKPMLVTWPFVMLLLDYWPLKRISDFRFPISDLKQLLLEKIPFLALALAGGLLTLHAEKVAGALPGAPAFPLPLRIANAAVSSVCYLFQTVWPARLAAFYPYPGSYPASWVVGALVLLGLISLATLWLVRRHPYLAIGWLWYLITLAPVSGLIQVGYHARADRYTYVPLIGIFLMASWGGAALCSAGRYRRVGLYAAAVAGLVALLMTAHFQTSYWNNSVSLWTRALACTSENALAHYDLGIALAAQGRVDEAIPQLERVLQLKPDDADTHNNLGSMLVTQGRLEEGIQHYERALQLKPGYTEVRSNLGVALATQGRLDEAVQQYERALQLTPDSAEIHNNLGIALAAQGKVEEAIPHFQQALNLAVAQANPALAENIRARLQSYQPNNRD